jgi:hypothetical protein
MFELAGPVGGFVEIEGLGLKELIAFFRRIFLRKAETKALGCEVKTFSKLDEALRAAQEAVGGEGKITSVGEASSPSLDPFQKY